MSITKRTLTKWRKEALHKVDGLLKFKDLSIKGKEEIVIHDRILLMTQELLDQELLKEADKDEG